MGDVDPLFTGTYLRRSDTVFAIVDNELIIMDEADEIFYSTNAVGTAIWNAIETPASLDQITDAVCSTFPDADLQIVRADALELLEQMERRALVERRDS